MMMMMMTMMTMTTIMHVPFFVLTHHQGVHTGTEADKDSVPPADMDLFRRALLLPLSPAANDVCMRWPCMKLDFCRWVFGYPRLPRVARLKVVRSGRFFGHTCVPSELQLPPLQHAHPFVAPYRFQSADSRSSHRDAAAALLESLEVYCKDAIHPGNPMSE